MNRLALCIGINRYPQSALAGCVNDAMDWGNELSRRGYEVSYLIDDQATLANIVNAIQKLMAVSKYRDRLVITYSGHGTYGRDLSGDESDQRDEAICPVDCFQVGMLYDDELKNLMSGRAFGSRLFFFSDSCFSATVNRFFQTDYRPIREVDRAIIPRRVRFLPPYELPARTKQITTKHRTLAGTPALLISGCDDIEYSYDAWFGNRANGAATRYALDALRQNPKNYNAWFKLIREQLPNDEYPQSPQLDGSYYKKRQEVL